jgi:signal peptidase I
LKKALKKYMASINPLEILIPAAVILFVLFLFLWPFEIIGDSMQPAVYGGDYVFISRAASFCGFMENSDVIVFRYGGEDVVKRLIALPGEHIQIKSGNVFVNGVKQRENYLPDSYTEGDVDILLKKGEYFLLGDNRSLSHDSRQIGPVTKSMIKGKVLVRFLPVNDFKFF